MNCARVLFQKCRNVIRFLSILSILWQTASLFVLPGLNYNIAHETVSGYSLKFSRPELALAGITVWHPVFPCGLSFSDCGNLAYVCVLHSIV